MVASPATAAQNATEGEQAEEGNAVNEIVCRRVAAPTGTRIGRRQICKTQHQWDLIEQESRNVIEDIGNRSRVGNEGGGG
ncbi:MAG: hypothetical protein ABR601_04195 [Parasphingopyxis sp.]